MRATRPPLASAFYGGFFNVSQNCLGDIIFICWICPTSKISLSPVTKTSAFDSRAADSIGKSSWSLMLTLGRPPGLAITLSALIRSMKSSMRSGGTRNWTLKTRLSSVSTCREVMRSWAAKTSRNKSAQSPRVAAALARTLVSRKTLTILFRTRRRR